MLLLICNIRRRKILRYAAVAGCNPVIYETDVQEEWFLFEKNIYSQRLKDGSLREITQTIEQHLMRKITEEGKTVFYNHCESGDTDQISQLIKDQLKEIIKYDTGSDFDIHLEFDYQKLNLRQFRYLTDKDKVMDEFKFHLDAKDTSYTLIDLDMELVTGEERGPQIKVEDIEAGDMVYTEITDHRDIGIYLSHLLGARRDDGTIPFLASVEDVKDTPEGVEVIVRYGPGIVGRTVEDAKKKVGIIESPSDGVRFRWILLLAIAAAVLYYLIVRGR